MENKITKAYSKIDNLCCLNHNSSHLLELKIRKKEEITLEDVDFFQGYKETKDDNFCKDANEMVSSLEIINEIIKSQDSLNCPLNVFLGLATHTITQIYIEYDDFSGNYASPYCTDEDIVVAYASGIYDNNEIDGLHNPEWKVETNMGTFPLSDYGKHFWLKKDKSE